jgi:hypothetical protein
VEEINAQLSDGKIVIAVFWVSEGVIPVDFLPHAMLQYVEFTECK